NSILIRCITERILVLTYLKKECALGSLFSSLLSLNLFSCFIQKINAAKAMIIKTQFRILARKQESCSSALNMLNGRNNISSKSQAIPSKRSFIVYLCFLLAQKYKKR